MRMSKRIAFAPAAFLAVMALLTGISQPFARSNSTTEYVQPSRWLANEIAPQNPSTTAASRNTALVAATEEVLKETSELRQLSILRPVPSSTQSRAEIERALIKSMDEETTPAEMHATEVTFKKLGLAPAGFEYRAL